MMAGAPTDGSVEVKYMLLIFSNDQTWAALSEDARRALGRGHFELGSELIAAGTYLDGAGLAGEERSRTVRVRKGDVLATDGPYVESKEHLAGFYVVECDSHDEAVAIAARIPDAAVNFVEVRPIEEGPMPLPNGDWTVPAL